MTIRKIIEYCMNTPVNTNPAILKQMIEEIINNGESAISVNGNSYKTFSEAVAAVPENGTIEVEDDVELEERLVTDKNLTLKLNGNSIIAKDGGVAIKVHNGSTVVIDATKGNSVINGMITLGDGTTKKDGHLVINGGTYVNNSNDAVFHTNGLCENCTIKVSNATIQSNDDSLYIAGNGKYEFINCVINGYTGAYIKSGDVKFVKTKIIANGPQAEPVPNGNGASSTGDGIILDSKSGYKGNMSLILEECEIYSVNGYAIREALTDLSESSTVNIEVKSGKYISGLDSFHASEAFDKALEEEKANCAFYGGTYSSEIDSKYLTAGKKCELVNGKYVIR